MDLKRYPDKIKLKDIPSAIGASDMPLLRALGIIMEWVNQHGLILHITHSLYGVDVANEIDDVRDEQGDISNLLVTGKSVSFDSSSKDITFKKGHIFSEEYVTISRFSCDNVDYYPTDESGMMVEFPAIDIDCFYCNRSHLEAFLQQLDNLGDSNTNRIPSTHCKKQVLRELAFRIWLATKADMEIIDNSRYQTCYEHIGEPTQDEVWEFLRKANRELFRAGKDDFFKKQNIIRFKDGTGKGRN